MNSAGRADIDVAGARSRQTVAVAASWLSAVTLISVTRSYFDSHMNCPLAEAIGVSATYIITLFIYNRKVSYIGFFGDILCVYYDTMLD